MSKPNNIVYFVEGETERKLIEVLKTDLQLIVPGKVRKLNPVEYRITRRDLLQYGNKTMLVFLFDTDTGNAGILQKNIILCKKMPNIDNVICIPQVSNLEDELEYSCTKIKDVSELTNSRSRSDFKRDFLKDKNIPVKLERADFRAERLWSRKPQGLFCDIENGADRIRKKRK